MEITRNSNSISLSQTKYLRNILEKYKKSNLILVSSPSKPRIKLEKNKEQASLVEINYY